MSRRNLRWGRVDTLPHRLSSCRLPLRLCVQLKLTQSAPEDLAKIEPLLNDAFSKYFLLFLPTPAECGDDERWKVQDLRDLDPTVRRRIKEKLEWLAAAAGQVRLEPLTADLAGVFKLRVGDWRVVLARYDDRRQLVVHVVAHRREVYRVARMRLEG